MARHAIRIETGHERLRLRGPTLGESECCFASREHTRGINREEGRVQSCSIGAEDTDLVMLGQVLCEHEPVSSRGQHASGNLNRLVKSEFGGLIRLICSCSGQHDCEGKQKSHNVKHLFYVHLFLLTMTNFF